MKENPMRFLVVLTACARMCAAAEPPLPSLSVDGVPEGSLVIVRNIHSVPLTAFLVEMVGYPGGSFRHLQDNVESEAIAPGVTSRILVKSMLAGAAPDYCKLQAAVYADGTVAGPTDKVEQIISDRRRRLKMLRQQIEKPAANSSADALEKLRKSERALAASKPSLD